jgi:hypothetical protein
LPPIHSSFSPYPNPIKLHQYMEIHSDKHQEYHLLNSSGYILSKGILQEGLNYLDFQHEGLNILAFNNKFYKILVIR